MLKNVGHVTYHFLVVAVSAALALSIPAVVSYLAQAYLRFWTLTEHNEGYLVAAEVAIAAALILFLNDLRRNWKDRRLSRTARAAGLLLMSPGRGLLARWNAARLKREQGRAREVMIIGATGFRTFVDPSGDLHEPVKNCREARIMDMATGKHRGHTHQYLYMLPPMNSRNTEPAGTAESSSTGSIARNTS